MSCRVVAQQAREEGKDTRGIHEGDARDCIAVCHEEVMGCVENKAELEGDEDENVDKVE